HRRRDGRPEAGRVLLMDLLRFTTAGSVDDGKTTLIGRLLVDSRAIPDDQYEALRRASRSRSEVDLAFVTDGLRAEREQGITIDVAYRYFATARRSFIIADTPGHEQYTRNMVTGASSANLSVVLVDAAAGITRQSRRHAAIASLLRIPHLLVAVNKMDLVDYSEDAFRAIADAFREYARRLDLVDVVCIPISALHGDNVVTKSERMRWDTGPTLLHYLENVTITSDANVVDLRLPIQTTLRAPGLRALAGEVASGTIRRGDPIVVLPSGVESRVERIEILGRDTDEAGAGMPVAVTLAEEVDAGRGDMLARPGNRPVVATGLDADICWMAEEPLEPGRVLLVQQTTRQVQARLRRIVYRLDVDSLHRESQAALRMNDIGRVEIDLAGPLCVDPYRINRRTGSFILIDPDSFATVGAGMVRGPLMPPQAVPGGALDDMVIDRTARERRHGHRAAVVWLTGLSGAGKSTIAEALDRRLFGRGIETARLDGDHLRQGLSQDLGFSADDRAENIRRAGAAARLFFDHGSVVIC